MKLVLAIATVIIVIFPVVVWEAYQYFRRDYLRMQQVMQQKAQPRTHPAPVESVKEPKRKVS